MVFGKLYRVGLRANLVQFFFFKLLFKAYDFESWSTKNSVITYLVFQVTIGGNSVIEMWLLCCLLLLLFSRNDTGLSTGEIDIHLNKNSEEETMALEKYALSNAMALSGKKCRWLSFIFMSKFWMLNPLSLHSHFCGWCIDSTCSELFSIFLLTGLRICMGEYKAQGPTLCPTEGRKKFITW